MNSSPTIQGTMLYTFPHGYEDMFYWMFEDAKARGSARKVNAYGVPLAFESHYSKGFEFPGKPERFNKRGAVSWRFKNENNHLLWPVQFYYTGSGLIIREYYAQDIEERDYSDIKTLKKWVEQKALSLSKE